MNYDTSFWNRVAERYAKSPIANESRYQQKLAATQRMLRSNMDVFEFGCGTGSTALLHAPYVNSLSGYRYIQQYAGNRATKT